MGTKARVNFRARISLAKLHIRVRSEPVTAWPEQLSNASKLLTSELNVSDAKARSIILKAVSAAHRCVGAQNQQLLKIEEERTRRRIRSACTRVANCIKRASAVLRRRLDQQIFPLRATSIDLEVLEAFFETARRLFAKFPDDEASRTAFRSLRGVHFSGLSAASRDKVEKAIAAFQAKTKDKHRRTAARLFTKVAEALGGEEIPKESLQIGNHIVRYLVDLADIWRQAGLKPTVAHDYLHLNPSTYRSRFHQFAELVLTSMMEPRDRSGSHDFSAHSGDLRATAAVGSRGAKPWIDASMRDKKYKWVVSYTHIRSALRR